MPQGGSVAWALMTALSALIVALGAPVLGQLADRHDHIRPALVISTAGTAVFVCSLWFVQPGDAVPALLLSALVIIFSELGFVYYNSLLPVLVPASLRGRVSAYGWGLGYAGALLALVLVLFILILPQPPYFSLLQQTGAPVRLAMIFAGLWFLLFSLPLIFTRTEPATRNIADRPPFFAALKQGWQSALAIPGMLRFLLSRMAYSDGLITLFAFGGIYAAKIFSFTQQEILIFAIALNVSAGIGAVLSGPLTDRLGPLAVIRASLLCLFCLGMICVLTTQVLVFWAASMTLGLFIGPCQAAGRVWVASHAAPGQQAGLFGILALSGKLTAFVGPLGFAALVALFGTERAGMAVVLGLFLLGFFLLPSKQHESKQHDRG